MKISRSLFALSLCLIASTSYASPFALAADSLCNSYADTKWIGPQMGGGFKLSIEKNGEDTSRLYGDVEYYGGNFEFGKEGTCVDNFADDSVTISFNYGEDGYITVKGKGKDAKKLTIVSGAMSNHDDKQQKITGELTRV